MGQKSGQTCSMYSPEDGSLQVFVKKMTHSSSLLLARCWGVARDFGFPKEHEDLLTKDK